jgi:ubiquinone/menaquinone biosynthesis C-methylase UbiE
MKLNMGCGHNKLRGWVNVDLFSECSPDLVLDLEALPWPWPDDSVDQVLFNHSLEHLGQNARTFLGIMKELYRVCQDGAQIQISVPHPRHDHFIDDPTHVRVITPGTLTLFDRRVCDEWQRKGSANSPLAHYLNVDFEMVVKQLVLAEPYATQYGDKQLSEDDLERMSRQLNNVVQEYRMILIARKRR